jgi:hypothetical protein
MKSVSLIKKSFVGTESSYPELRSKSDMNNYRPIYVISTIAKVMEKVVHDQLYLYLQEEDLLSNSQHGFRPGHSTTKSQIDGVIILTLVN